MRRLFSVALIASGVYGLGYGFVTPGTNLWVGESYGHRRASALNLANLAWALAPCVPRPAVMYAIRKAQVNSLLYLFGALTLLLAIALARMNFGKLPHEETTQVSKENSQIAGTGVAILLGTLFYVYVGTEVSTSYWAATHAQRAAAWATNTYTLAPTFFFAGLLGGRGAAAAILLHLKEATVAVSGLLIAATGELVFVTSHSPAGAFHWSFFCRLGTIQPIQFLSLGSRMVWLARSKSWRCVMFAMAAVGSATMPPLVGVVSRLATTRCASACSSRWPVAS